jgi:uncharacterized protein
LKSLLALLVFIFCYPTPIDGQRVYDYGGFVSEQGELELERLSAETEKETSAQVAVVTVYSLDNKDIDTYANELFNDWGIGQKDLNNGVLFLIAPIDRRTRIEVGRGLEALITDSLAGEILDGAVVPLFKKDKIEEGIIAGTKELTSILRKYPEAARGVAGSEPAFILTRSKKTFVLALASLAAAVILIFFPYLFGKKRSYRGIVLIFTLIGFISLLAFAFITYKKFPGSGTGIVPLIGAAFTGILALLQNMKRYRRYKPHFCPKCATQMNLIEEDKDDARLSKEQILEEGLKSADYDVWQCPACLDTQIKENVVFFSKYSKCKQCKVRAYSETTQVIVAATRMSSGSAKVTGTCKACQFQNVYSRTLPRLQSSSSSRGSSGGGSFGGGSSGGGGSSRGW